MMKNFNFSLARLIFVVSVILMGTGCVSGASSTNNSFYDVTLSQALRMDSFLVDTKFSVGISKTVLAAQLKAPWSFSVEVGVEGEETTQLIRSCADYLATNRHAEPIKPYEFSVYRAAGVACDALQVALSMEKSSTSFVRELTFDKKLAQLLPHQIALVISTEEEKRLEADPEVRVWSDIETVESVNQLEADVFNFKTAGATHTLKRLALGDVNGDGIEDLMIRDDVTVDEGSYSSSRLFVFTKRSARHDIEILN